MVVSRIRHPYGYRSDDLEADGGRSYRRHRYNAARGPIAILLVDPESGALNLDVTAILGGSYDANAESMTYELDWGDGTTVASTPLADDSEETHQYTTEPKATAELLVDGQPSDGDTVEIDDGQGNTVTFEFESGGGVGGGNEAVTIGGDADATATNLAAAIDGSALEIGAAVDGSTANQVNLTHEAFGAAGNDATITPAGTNPPTVQQEFQGGGAFYDVVLTVTDASSNVSTDTKRITIIDSP